MSRISIIGLGKLGTPMAAVYASKGHKVVGIDKNEKTVSFINRGTAPVRETGLSELMNRYPFTASTDYARASNTDITYVIVPTPSLESGDFSNEYVLDAMCQLGEAIANKKRYHLVVICSTVMPGSTDGAIREELERASGKTVGIDIGLCYSPEFIALGSVIENLLNPDMVLIGESDKRAGDKLEKVTKTIVSAPIRRMNLVNAELAKIAVNSYVTMKISYANTLAEICWNLPDADASVVAMAVGLDSRIGRKYLSPAAAYGGPCFPRDSIAFTALADQLGVQSDLAKATQSVNVRQTERLVEIAHTYAEPGDFVAVLGLAYKPFTNITEESAGIALAKRLKEDGFVLHVFDPSVTPGETDFLHGASVTDTLSGARVAFIMTPWPQFKDMVPRCFHDRSNMLLVDCWNITSPSPWDDTNIIRIGKNQ